MKMKVLSVALVMATLFTSCKKNVSDHAPSLNNDASTQKAQAWFEKESNKQSMAGRVPATELRFGNVKPQWSQVRHFTDDHQLIVPAELNKSKSAASKKISRYLVMEENASGDISSGYYLYVLGTGSNTPVIDPALLSGKTSPEHFTGALARYSIDGRFISSSHYDDGKICVKQDKLATKEGAPGPVQNSVPLDEGCSTVTIDWYWQTYVNGVLVYEEYLYSTTQIICEGGGGGSGGNSQQQCQNALNQMIGDTHAASTLTSIETVSESPTQRTKKYKWICLKNLTWLYESVDYGTHKFVPTPSTYTPDWEWVSFQHHSINFQGTSYGGTVAVENITADATMGKYNAIMNLDITLKYDIVCQYVPLPSTFITYPCHKGFNVDSPGQIVQPPTD